MCVTESQRNTFNLLRQIQKILADTGDRRAVILWRLFERSDVVDRGYESPCYEWGGRTSGKGRGGGYGRMCLNDTTVAVHKVAWTNRHGYIPPGRQIDHKCNNRLCWRDEHLQMVTPKRNQKLKIARRSAAVVIPDDVPEQRFQKNRQEAGD